MFSSWMLRIVALAVAVFLWSPPALAQMTGQTPGQGVDYIFPTKALVQRAGKVKVLPGPALFGGDKVLYTAFDGKTHELTRFQGRFVAILLPDSWMGPGALGEDLVHLFVDRADITYSHLADFMRAEPAGEGPLIVAILPEGATCGWGCGFIGSKGVEIADIPHLNPILWREIAADKGMSVLVHEMTHNFDVYWPYLYYLPGHPHAWTDFVNLYLFLYSREGTADETPAELARRWLATTGPYFADGTADWKHCVRDGACEARGITANNAWGGFGFRVALFYGPRAARGSMAFLRDYSKTHQPPATPEGKEDLYVEALAAGAGRNLSCVVDAWRWHASPALRRRMKQRWGTDNPVCKDVDRDRWTPLRGDCDDTRSSVRPGKAEVQNGLDDDCDGMADEVSYAEPASGDFPAILRLALPAVVAGEIADDRDSDRFSFRLTERRRVRVGLCARTFQGWLFLYDQGGHLLNGQYAGARTCSRSAYDLAPGRIRFEVVLNAASFPGTYTVDAEPTPPWPAPPWAQTGAPVQDGEVWLLAATPVFPASVLQPAKVRFWVNGQGIVGTVPYAPSVSFAWTPPPGFDPRGATWRVQLVAGGAPAADYTPPRPFPG